MDRKITDAKEYLSQIRTINIKLKSLARQRQALEDSLFNTSPKLSHTPRPATRDVHRMDGLIAAKLDIENEMEAASQKLAEVHRTIASVQGGFLSAVLTYRYIDQKPWVGIASALHLSESRVYQLHREALAEIEKSINEREVKSA